MFAHIAEELFDTPDAGSGGGEGGGLEGVIAGAIAEAEGSGGEAGGEGEAPPAPAPDDAEEKELAALQADIRAKNPNMRGTLAVDRHQAVLTRARNQHQKAIEEWTAKEKAWQSAEAKYKQDLSSWDGMEWSRHPDVQAGLQALALSESDPQAFVNLLLQDQRFAELIQLKEAQEAAEGQRVSADMPGPNQKSQDGSFSFYDNDGIKALLDWHGHQVRTSTRAEMEKATKQQMDALKEEIKKEYGDVANAFRATQVWNQAVSEQKSELEQMRATWAGFKEHEKEIKAALVANIQAREKDPRVPLLTAERAYIQVVAPKLQQATTVNEQAMRAKILEEMKGKKAAAGGAVKAGGVERTGDSGPRDLADIIRESLPRA